MAAAATSTSFSRWASPSSPASLPRPTSSPAGFRPPSPNQSQLEMRRYAAATTCSATATASSSCRATRRKRRWRAPKPLCKRKTSCARRSLTAWTRRRRTSNTANSERPPPASLLLGGGLVQDGDLALEGFGDLAGIAECRQQVLGDARADEMRDVAAELTDLLDEARRDELIAVACHQEDGLDLRVEARIHPRHLELILEIGDGAQPADDHGGADRHREMHQQIVECTDLDPLMGAVGEGGDLLAHDGDALLGRKDRPLAGIAGNADDQFIDQPGRSQDDVGMPVGDRVEGARVNAYPHLGHRCPPFCAGSRRARHRSSSQLSGGPEGFASSGVVPPASPLSPAPPSPPLPSPLPPLSSPMSPSRATETTCSPSPTLKTTTPWLGRRAMRISKTGQRMTVPPSVTSMIWSLWVTGNTATT